MLTPTMGVSSSRVAVQQCCRRVLLPAAAALPTATCTGAHSLSMPSAWPTSRYLPFSLTSSSSLLRTDNHIGMSSWAARNSVQRIGRSTTIRVASAPTGAAESSVAPSDTQETSGFQHLGLRQQLTEALTSLKIEQPTEVQKLSIPALMQGGDFLMTSHTGSGKTLAYLLPIVEQLKRQEAAGFVPAPKRPRVIVLGPTKELIEQITGVAKLLSHHAKIRVVCATSQGRSRAVQESALSGPVDVVVTSPTKLIEHLKEGRLFLRDVQWLVVDEADTIFAEGWGAELGEILVPVRSKTQPAHVVLVSATMTKPIKRLLSAQFPDIKSIQTKSTHHAIAGSKHTFVTQPPGKDKIALLLEMLAPDSGKKQLVFCNSVDSCRAVEHACREAGLATINYHGDMPVAARQESMRTFNSAGAPGWSGPVPVMIASDVAARGLDFSGHVDHVVNFDFPYTAVDYIHRSGRTARAGRTGRISSIVTKKDRVLAQRVEWALEHNEPLDQLSSNPDILPPSQRPELKSQPRGRSDDRDKASGFRGKSSGKASAKGRPEEPPKARRGAARFELMQERLEARKGSKAGGGRSASNAGPSKGRPARPSSGGSRSR